MNKLSFFAAQAANVSGETLLKGIPGNVTTMTLKAPVGVVGGIIPWNGPLNGQFWIVGAVPASGCTTVLKPGGRVAIGAPSGGDPARGRGAGRGRRHRSGQGGRPRAGRPPDVDRIAFTGSTETERRIIEASTVNIKKLQLELGGKSADIVCADADLGKVVPGATMGGLRQLRPEPATPAPGSWCSGPSSTSSPSGCWRSSTLCGSGRAWTPPSTGPGHLPAPARQGAVLHRRRSRRGSEAAPRR
jgi:hypothetical protein